jgi:hypothetical protein
MIGFKFLGAGSIGRFSESAWPTPGTWVEAGSLEPCVDGVHACSADALAYWFDDELWTVELDGEMLDLGTVLIAQRGRLVSRVDGWPDVSRAFADDCAARAAAFSARESGNARVEGLAAEAAEHAARAVAARHAVIAAYATAVAADVVEPGGFDDERRRQSRTLADLLGL